MRHAMSAITAGVAALLATTGLSLAGTEYTIVDLGVIAPGDAMQGLRISSGGVMVGRSLGSNQGFTWTDSGGLVALPNLASRPYAAANGSNDSGVVVGTGAETFFGTNPLPLIWNNGVVSQLQLPAGETIGRANDVNAAGVAVGSADGGSNERAAIYSGGSASIITATGPGGIFMTTAFSINDSGLVVGIGLDPNNAARNVGMVYDSVAGTAFEVGALPGLNAAICFGVSNAGHVVGSSMQFTGSGTPFIWTAGGGMTEIPLPPATSQGSAKGANSSGHAVGTAGGQFAVPFYYDGTMTVSVASLLPIGSAWDLDMNTSSSAIGISDSGVIVGTGVLNGDIRAYALIPAGTICDADLNGSGAVDVDDLVQVILSWETPNGDVTGDNRTDVDDLIAVIIAWGSC